MTLIHKIHGIRTSVSGHGRVIWILSNDKRTARQNVQNNGF